MLSIHLFGQPYLTLEAAADAGSDPPPAATVFPFNAPPKTLPLLAYLLLHRGQAVERQQVAFQLWPDDPESTARANLRRHVYHLQRALPPAPPERPWLLVEPARVRWNPQADYWLDVAEFERRVGQSELRAEALAEAVALYRGDLLETVYEDWVFFERERLRDLYFQALHQLVYQHRTRREFPAAIHYAQQLLGRDPFQENTLRQLMAVRYESGDRAAALQDYETFERALRQEMGVAPMPETQALYELVLHNARLPGAAQPAAAAAAPELAAPSPCASPALPFVGRAPETRQLGDHWKQAAGGHGGLVLVGGEAGVGKTRLGRELALQVEREGGRVLFGGSAPGEPRPHGAVMEALQSALPLLAALDAQPKAGPPAGPGRAPTYLAALADLLPGLRTRRSLPKLPALDPDKERTRLFDAVATCLEKLAEPRPLLLILEDLHWAGEASLALVEFLARRAAGSSILILGTYRDEETLRTHPLRSLRRRLQDEGLVGHLALSRLSRAAVEELLGLMAPIHKTGQPAGRLYAQSEGNPFFIELLLQSVEEAAPGAVEAQAEAALPGGLLAAVARRLAHLPDSVRAYAEVAAVLGPTFDAEAVREVGGWDEAQAHDALGGLLDCRVVRDAAGRSTYDFAFGHHLYQAGLYEQIPSARRARRHRRAAEVLEDLYPQQREELAGELAAHYDRGGDPGRAAGHYLTAARRRLAVFADAEALAALDRGLALAESGQVDPGTVFELLMLRESIYQRLGRRAERLADLERLEALPILQVDPERTCQVLRRRIAFNRELNDFPAARAAIEALGRQAEMMRMAATPAEAPDRPADAPDRRARYWQTLAWQEDGLCALSADEYPLANERLQAAQAAWAALGETANQVYCCCYLGDVAIQLRQMADVERWTGLALALCDENSPADLLMRTLWSAAAKALASKALPDCLAYAGRLLDVARQAGNLSWQAGAHRLLGQAYTRLFRVQEAYQHLQAALELYRRSQRPKGIMLGLETLALWGMAVGRYAEAKAYYDQLFEILDRVEDPSIRVTAYINLAFLSSCQQDYAAELTYGRLAAELAREMESRFLEALGLQNMGEAESELGHLDSAIQHLQAGANILAELELFGERVSVLADLAVALLRAGNLSVALVVAEEIVAGYPQVRGTDDNVHRFIWNAARVLHAAGRAPEAVQALDQAYTDFQTGLNSIPDPESRQAFAGILYNRRIVAAYERGEWPVLD